MNERTMGPSSPAADHRLPQPRGSRLGPLEAFERGFALFQTTFAQEGWRYYTGTIPVLFLFIPIWVLNGQIRISNGAILAEASLLSIAYLFRTWMVSEYMGRVRNRAFSTPIAGPSGKALRAATLGRQFFWKSTLSAAALITLPSLVGASWFYSASQFASLEAQDGKDRKRSFAGCLGLSTRCLGDGLLLFLILIPFWIAVWINGLMLAIILPQLLHSMFGVNTLLSTEMGFYSLLQSSGFWLSLSAAAWVALDPIVKCTFVILHQNVRARREGDDLRTLLATLPRDQEEKARLLSATRTVSTMLLGFILLLLPLTTASARQTTVTETASKVERVPVDELRVQRLRQALDEESQRAVYRWHDAEHPTPPTWIERWFAKIADASGRALNAVWDLLHRLWPHGPNLSTGNVKGGGWKLKDIRSWLLLVGGLTLAVGTVLVWMRRRRESDPSSIPVEIVSVPDLSDTAVATERSEDEWFQLAIRLEKDGELRFALRAAYLGLLAGLGQRQWLTIRRDRTNREYLTEFTRRWRRRPQAAVEIEAEVPEKLSGSLRQFDRVWYGAQAVSPETVTAYRRDQMELLDHV